MSKVSSSSTAQYLKNMCLTNHKLSFQRTLNLYKIDLLVDEVIVTQIMLWHRFLYISLKRLQRTEPLLCMPITTATTHWSNIWEENFHQIYNSIKFGYEKIVSLIKFVEDQRQSYLVTDVHFRHGHGLIFIGETLRNSFLYDGAYIVKGDSSKASFWVINNYRSKLLLNYC